MTVHQQGDEGADSGDARVPPGRQLPTAGEYVDVQNTVVAAVLPGVVTQAHTINTVNIHHHPPAEAVRPVPRQLPATLPGFVGRTAELAALTSALEQQADGGTVTIAALTGAGGIGKTCLALHWAHQHAHRFPDGQLFVDLRGFSPPGQPMPPEAAVRGFLDALGADPARMPRDLHAQAALYRSLVAGKRVLIVLDNAATLDQLRPLLPGTFGCMVVVTSRLRLTGLVTTHGAHPIQPEVLTPAEAHHLLATRLGADRVRAEPDAVTGLLAACGGFPLALAIVAGRARSFPRTPLATLAAELRTAVSGLDAFDNIDPATSLPAVLSWSYRALTAWQREAFGLLGIAPGPDIGLAAVASLTAQPPAPARRVLRELEEVSLLEHDGHGRWRMHDLIRADATAAAERDLTDEIRAAALRRVVDSYLHTAHAADRLLNPHRQPTTPAPAAAGSHCHDLTDHAAALAWFDAEHTNLLAAQRAAADHGWHRAVADLAWTLVSYHDRRGHLQDRITAWQAVLAIPAPVPAAMRIRAHRHLGRAYADLGRPDAAIEQLRRGLVLAQDCGDRTQVAHCHRDLGSAWGSRGDNRKALAYATQALALFRALGSPVWEANALHQAARYAVHLGEHDTARAHGQAALALHRRHGNPAGTAAALESLGVLEHVSGNHDRAVEHYEQALALRRELGDSYRCAGTLDQLGQSLAALGRHERARAVWREALELYREQNRGGDSERVQQRLDNLGACDDSGGHPTLDEGTVP
ncbi:tetratricopeptide repeat protein [Crossiella sp. CA-258035]|uniref:ATP-binding protein n=1 Tax=Crossiella sp. CA-258035 TaxID=2981138 RepID=UPI0024BC4076|nr:tetratricopeptide repeat protein [Crossiella sp. CA-258035]WHT23364.1 tetratricopeptide repeat protein [Crossiella sp. CA-258035]